MSKFCPQCGAENNDNIVFCKNCYYRFEDTYQAYNQIPNPNYQNQQNYQGSPNYQNQQYNPNMYQQNMQYYQKPKTPGKGFGIASLCLGIESFSLSLSSLYYVFMICLFSTAAAASSDFPNGMVFVYAVYVGIFLCISLICGVLGLIFGKVAENKGYQNGVSKAGKLVSIIGLCGCGLAIIIVILVLVFMSANNVF